MRTTCRVDGLRSLWLVACLLLGGPLAGCRTGADAAPSKGQARPVTTASSSSACPVFPDGQECHGTTCGGNSPDVNAFPINGLHIAHCPNPLRVRLDDQALHRGRSGCPADAALDHDGKGGLIGKDADGQVVCRGSELIGATIELVRETKGDVAYASLLIAEAGLATDELGRLDRPAYLFVDAHHPDRSLCQGGGADLWRGSLAPLPRPTPAVAHVAGLAAIDAARQSAFAVVVAGVLYDRKADAYPQIADGSDRWINLACAGDALGKMTIEHMVEHELKLDEHTTSPATIADAREATLKMITAKYCDGWSMTQEHTVMRRSPADVPSTDMVEARWGPSGATCLSHARIWRANSIIPWTLLPKECRQASTPCDEQAALTEVRNTCHTPPPPCEGPGGNDQARQPSDSGLPTNGAFWTTYVVDHAHQ